MAALYAEYHLLNDGYTLSQNIKTSIGKQFAADTATYAKDLAAYEASGADFDTMNANILDGIFVRIAENTAVNPYGWEAYPRLFKIYLDPLPPFVSEPLSESQGYIYFIAGLSAATGSDLRSQFREWGFPVDDDYYDKVYPTVACIVRSTTNPPICG